MVGVMDGDVGKWWWWWGMMIIVSVGGSVLDVMIMVMVAC